MSARRCFAVLLACGLVAGSHRAVAESLHQAWFRPTAGHRLSLPPALVYRPEQSASPHGTADDRASAPAAAPDPATLISGLPSGLEAVVEGATAPTPPPAPDPKNLVLPGRSAPQMGPLESGNATADAAEAPIASEQSGGLLMPFGRNVGAAAFISGGDILVVFDEAHPFDLSAIQHDALGRNASVQTFEDTTVLRLAGQAAGHLDLRRIADGWLVSSVAADLPVQQITPIDEGGAIRFPVETPGRAVVVADAISGRLVLVGTVKDGEAAIAATAHRAAAIVRQTILGVVIDPLSERLELRGESGAFLLTGLPPEASSGSGRPFDMSDDTSEHVLDLRATTLGVTVRRLEDAKQAAAAAPARDRFKPRIQAAEAALALADSIEAATLARVALADAAPASTADRAYLILAAANLLNGDLNETDLLDDAQLPQRGETALWRAVKLALKSSDLPEAAGLFAINLPYLQTYPPKLQAILTPIAAEALVQGGTQDQAALIDKLGTGPPLAFARALLQARLGQKQLALAALARLAGSRDLRLADRAAEAAIDIVPPFDPAAARRDADILEAHLLSARIAGHELSTLKQLESLREKAGQWSIALDLVKEIGHLEPAADQGTRARGSEVLQMLAQSPLPASGSEALDQAALIEDNIGYVSGGGGGDRIALALADRLVGLELPERAAPIVQKLMQAQDPGPEKVQLGMHMASLALQLNDPAGALAALTEAGSEAGSQSKDEERVLLIARALSGQGRWAEAIKLLDPLTSPPALDLAASLEAEHGDWSHATDKLLELIRKTPADQADQEAARQDLLLRLASASSRSGDKVRMQQAHALVADQVADPSRRALLDLLTSDPDGDALSARKFSQALQSTTP